MSELDGAKKIADQIGLKPGDSFQTQGQIDKPHYHRGGGGLHNDGYYVKSDGGVDKQHTDD